jgi:hypothetical protein
MRSTVIALVLGVAALTMAPAADAGILTFEYSYTYVGATPQGPTPWLKATFEDEGANVKLRLEANGLQPSSAFVTKFLFNLDPSLNPSLLGATWTEGSVPLDDWAAGTNSQKGPDNKFDVVFQFETGNSSDDRLDGSDYVSLRLTYGGAGAFSAQSFNFPALHLGTPTGLPTLAHIQGIPVENSDSDSGWVTSVPEPGTLLLLGSGVLGPAGFARRRR